MSEPVLAVDAILSSSSTSRPQTELQWTPLRRKFFERKYWIERLMGFVLLILFLPAIVFLWLLVKLTSSGPGFYRQTRVGLNNQEFKLIKLRSMVVDSEIHGQAFWAVGTDNRVTQVGKVLRNLHLDELPQLFNVARGEMALVGPRPERPSICKLLQKRIVDYYDRVLVKPGISGLSQINLESDSTLEDVIRKQTLDLRYINETNSWLEIRILIATALRMFGIKGETTMKLMRLCRRSLLEEPVAEKLKDDNSNCPVCLQPLQNNFDSNTDTAINAAQSIDTRHPTPVIIFPHISSPVSANQTTDNANGSPS